MKPLGRRAPRRPAPSRSHSPGRASRLTLPPAVMSSPVVQQLRVDLANLERQQSQLLERYPEQLRVVHKDYPIDSLHPAARRAHEAARRADEQGKIWAYHDAVYAMAPQAAPSITIDCPVTNDPAFEARKTAAPATSSGSPPRPRGTNRSPRKHRLETSSR